MSPNHGSERLWRKAQFDSVGDDITPFFYSSTFAVKADVPPQKHQHKDESKVSSSHIERQPTARPPALHPYTPQLRVLSWNVNGIRAQLAKEEGRKVLTLSNHFHFWKVTALVL